MTSSFVEATGVIDSTITPLRYVNAVLDTGHSDGDVITTVLDSATGGASPTQATSTKRPLYKTNVFASNPGYLFDGVDDVVTATAAAAKTHGTVFLLFKPAAIINTASSLAVPMGVHSSSGQANGWNLGASTGSLTNEVAVWQAPAAVRSAWTQSGGAISAAIHILTARWNSATTCYDIFLDGGVNLTRAVTGTPSETSDNVLCLGGTDQNTLFFGGHIGFCVVYAEIVTDAQKAAVHTYLAQNWGASADDRTDLTPSALAGGGFFAAV